MTCRLRRFVFLALATLGLAAGAWAEGFDLVMLYTPGYSKNQDFWSKGAYTAYPAGENPKINPDAQSGTGVSTAQPSKTFTFVYPGHYATNWALIKHGSALPHLQEIPDSWYGLTVTYSELKKLSGVSSGIDIVPLFAEMRYSLEYDPGFGGEWIPGGQPTATNLWWSQTIDAQPIGLCARTGYSQIGWRTTADASGTFLLGGQSFTGADIPVTQHNQAVTLFAQWQVNQYPLHLIVGKGIARIWYKVNGASDWSFVTETTDILVDFGTEWQAYTEPKDGYTYSGTSQGNPQKGTMTTAGATFEPSANPKSIVVSFNGNDATAGSMSEQTFTFDEGKYLAQNTFTRGYRVTFDTKGGTSCESRTATYHFKNWNNQADGLGDYPYDNQQMVTNPCGSTGAAVMLYAQWDTNSITPVILPLPEKGGADFSGWYAESGCSTKVGNAGDTYTPTNDVTLYAKWTTLSYTVTFYTDDPNAGGTPYSVQQVPYGESASEPEKKEKKYYKSNSWNTDEWRCVTANLSVWPLWVGKEYWLRMWKNYSPDCVEYEDSLEPCGIELTTKSIKFGDPKLDYGITNKVGYSFDCWAENRKGTGDHYGTDLTIAYKALDTLGGGNEHVDFYAIWSPNTYTVHFDGGQDSTGSMNDQPFTYDCAAALTSNGFQYVGQEFLHWHDAANGRDYADGEIVSNLTTTAGDKVTLTAVWSNYHYVRFDRNGATNENEMQVQQFSGSLSNTLNACDYGKIGYTFAGWATNAVAATNLCVSYTNGQSVAFPSALPNTTNTLYAVWATNHYTIVFDPGTNGVLGTMDPLTNCWYDTAFVITNAYVNDVSEKLKGWSRISGTDQVEYEAEHDISTLSNLTTEANGVVTLYAVWAGVGDLSKAVGLTNVVLRSTPYNFTEDVKVDCVRAVRTSETPDWDRGHDDRVVWQFESDESGLKINVPSTSPCSLSGVFRGAGLLRFSWCFRSGAEISPKFDVYDGDNIVTNLVSSKSDWKKNWDNPVEVRFASGLHTISWRFSGDISTKDIIAIDDVSWTPLTEVKPGEEITYETQAEAEAAAASAKVLRPNAAVEGVISADNYDAMFVHPLRVDKVSGAPDCWKLVPELTPSISNDVQQAVDLATIDLLEQIRTNTAPFSFAMTLKAGLYYGIAMTNDLRGIKAVTPNWILGAGAEHKFEVGKPSTGADFFELRATEYPPK